MIVPKLNGVLESPLYFDDLAGAKRFYGEVMGLEPMFEDDRLIACPIGEQSVLLMFRRGHTAEATHIRGGTVPGHEGQGIGHIAFAIGKDELPAWEAQLARHRIPIESRVDWPKGGVSLFFRDPEGNLLEVATPGLWRNY
jgi:catechol 2,3-dioxygenase-like lactoylglutathione lyase family enzyme